MNQEHIETIAQELNLTHNQTEAVAALLAEGATVPFIARYRKEATDSLDEVAITAIRDRAAQLAELDARKAAILKSLEQNGHLNDELQEKVTTAPNMAVLEDIYLPYRPKRRTRATIAREKGLEPLAEAILAQTGMDPQAAGADFVDPEKEVETVEAALAGARDIIAEIVNESEEARARLRTLYANKSVIKSTVAADKETEGAKYRDYFEWSEPITEAPSHRILAMRRGEREEMLNLSIYPPEDQALEILKSLFVTGEGPDSQQVLLAVQDSYKRLLSRAMETEIRLASKERADTEAIRIFAENLRQLLLASPLGAKRVLGIDPGFRTGCKVVCLDRQGKLLHHDTIYPHTSKAHERAGDLVRKLCAEYRIEAIAIGNGTAGRETEAFLRGLGLVSQILITLVNESGASIYSASDIARDEFPDLDLTVRGSVSIGRRMMDPLAELVKIDPKSIGVGQYQHDVDQTQLKQSLDDVVVSCVNRVGVDVNRASAQLLTYVSGLGPQLAKNIVAHRDTNGPFATRKELSKVKRLGPKAFEQAAGFLRIQDGQDPLDASAVHPESYPVVARMAKDLGCEVHQLIGDVKLRDKIDINTYVTDTVGLPTLNDILDELAKPGRDPRREFEEFAFAQGVDKISDLEPGMELPGVVTNITAFGAFVDVGVHQDGLIHVSELADRFVKNPAEVVKVHQKVKVRVLEVDIPRNRIGLSMRSGQNTDKKKAAPSKARKKTRPQNNRSQRPKSRGGSSAPKPFNNPFAELFDKQGLTNRRSR